MSDEILDEALRDLFAEEAINPELADALVAEARPWGWSMGWVVGGVALVAAVLALALLPDQTPSDRAPERPAAPADLPVGMEASMEVLHQAQADLGPCFDAVEARIPGVDPVVGLTFVLDAGSLVQIDGLEDSELDAAFADCVRDAAWEWAWPDQDEPVVLMLRNTDKGLMGWVPAEEPGVDVAFRVLELDEAGVLAAQQSALWDAEGFIPLDGFPDGLTGTVIMAPTLVVEWGTQGEFYAGGGLPDDGIEFKIVPWGGLSAEQSVRWSFRAAADEPVKGKSALLPEGATHLGMLYESGEALWLVTLRVER